MLDQNFIINVDRLRKNKDQKLKIEMSVSPEFLDVEEPELDFGEHIQIIGEAYLVDDQLVVHLDALVPLILVCKVCNGDASVMIKVNNFYHVEDLTALKSPYFDFSKVLREEILLEVPRFSECNEGNCPEREFMNQYLERKKS